MKEHLMKPRMFYFGPWERPGHYFFSERGISVDEEKIPGFPFGHYGNRIGVDGRLQPGCPDPSDRLRRRTRPETEGEAALHHIDGWTALCFWDYSVDARGACSSNYFAEGTFTFEEMVKMARSRFAERWSKMSFRVREVPTVTGEDDIEMARRRR